MDEQIHVYIHTHIRTCTQKLMNNHNTTRTWRNLEKYRSMC